MNTCSVIYDALMFVTLAVTFLMHLALFGWNARPTSGLRAEATHILRTQSHVSRSHVSDFNRESRHRFSTVQISPSLAEIRYILNSCISSARSPCPFGLEERTRLQSYQSALVVCPKKMNFEEPYRATTASVYFLRQQILGFIYIEEENYPDSPTITPRALSR